MSAREWGSVPIVLRVQDAALEMLNVLLPTPTYERRHTADYLSAEDVEDRKALIAEVRSWAKDTLGRSPSEVRWAGIRRARTRDALDALRRIAIEEKRTKEVLEELRTMFEGGRHWIYRPMICELMAELGDTSKVADVLAGFEEGKYSKQHVEVEGDSAIGTVAEESAERIQEKFGKPAKEKRTPPATGKDAPAGPR